MSITRNEVVSRAYRLLTRKIRYALGGGGLDPKTTSLLKSMCKA